MLDRMLVDAPGQSVVAPDLVRDFLVFCDGFAFVQRTVLVGATR